MTRASEAAAGRASGRFKDFRELGSASADSSSAGKSGVEVEV
jgi:hypothetical protein